MKGMERTLKHTARICMEDAFEYILSEACYQGLLSLWTKQKLE